jgi:hypothetical protein
MLRVHQSTFVQPGQDDLLPWLTGKAFLRALQMRRV